MSVRVGEKAASAFAQLHFKIPLRIENLLFRSLGRVNAEKITCHPRFFLDLRQRGMGVIPTVVTDIKIVMINRFLPPIVMPLVAPCDAFNIQYCSCLG